MFPLLGKVLRDVRDDADEGDACTMNVFDDPSDVADVVDFIEFRRSDIKLFAFKMCKFFALIPTIANAFLTYRLSLRCKSMSSCDNGLVECCRCIKLMFSLSAAIFCWEVSYVCLWVRLIDFDCNGSLAMRNEAAEICCCIWRWRRNLLISSWFWVSINKCSGSLKLPPIFFLSVDCDDVAPECDWVDERSKLLPISVAS